MGSCAWSQIAGHSRQRVGPCASWHADTPQSDKGTTAVGPEQAQSRPPRAPGRPASRQHPAPPRSLSGVRTREGAEPPPIDRAPHHGCAGRVKGQPAKRRPLGHRSSSVRQLGLHPFLEGRRSRGCTPCLDSGRAHDCSFGPVRLELILQWVKPKLGFLARGRDGVHARSGPGQQGPDGRILRRAWPPAQPAAIQGAPGHRRGAAAVRPPRHGRSDTHA